MAFFLAQYVDKEESMFERIFNQKSRFPRDGRMYVAVSNSGLTFSQGANARLRGHRRCVLLFDRENWRLGICPLKNGKMPGSFSLGFVGEGKANRHITGIRWLRREVVPHLRAAGRDIFQLQQSTTIPEFEGTTVYLADLNGGAGGPA
jgi:hypothetical protein